MTAINHCTCSYDAPGSFKSDHPSLKALQAKHMAQPELSRSDQTISASYVEYRASYTESQEYRGYKVFKRAVYSNETLQQFNPKFNSKKSESTPAPTPSASSPYLGNKQSPAQTASNILGFIERRLTDRDIAGASETELASLVRQAEEGIETGFAQARNDLEKLGLMTPELSEEIDQSYDLAMDGLEALKVKFGLIEPEQETEPVQSETTGIGSALPVSAPVLESNRPSEISSPSSKPLESSRISYQSSMRGSLMITTQDGDKVFLDETLIDVLKYKSVSRDDSTYTKFDAATRYSQDLKVIGSLDEEEMYAIEQLVGKASEIAGLMQTSDFQAALDLAMKLDFDASEIASFSLELSRTESFSSKAVVYRKPTPMNAIAPAMTELNSKISGIASLLDKLKVSNKNFAEFISQQTMDAPSFPRLEQSFKAIAEALLRINRGSDRG